jgi:hypothetical protein
VCGDVAARGLQPPLSHRAAGAGAAQRDRVHVGLRDRARHHAFDPRRDRPFHNVSKGGRHIHHSTFGIFGLLGIGYLWTYRVGVGDRMPEWASRVTAAGYGVAAALTLDEFALWLDLHDDYWDKQGRKSIDAVALFGGMLTIGVAGRDMINDLGLFPKRIGALVERDEARRAAARRAA